jgi:3',5'-cyclic AMP phosphodiesterase CpdA
MASTKAATDLASSVTVTKDQAEKAQTYAINLVDGYGANIGGKITNGATGPTVGCTVWCETSPDNSQWYERGGPIRCKLGNNIVTYFQIDLPPPIMYARLAVGGNTDQDVTLDADATEVTAIA